MARERLQGDTNGLTEAMATHHNQLTFFLFHKLVECLKSCGVVDVVGLEGDSEEVAIRVHSLLLVLLLRTTEAVHLAVLQLDVEVGELNIVTLSVLSAPAAEAITVTHR